MVTFHEGAPARLRTPRRLLPLSALALPLLLAAAPAGEVLLPQPIEIRLVGACTSPRPRLAPEEATVRLGDEVSWGDPSRQATGLSVAPDPDWPFAVEDADAARGEQASPGTVTGTTLRGSPVSAGDVFGYTVTVTCPGGRMQAVPGRLKVAGER